MTRLDERRYETRITRPDGVRFLVTGVGHMFAIPHDLAHLAVERALGLRRGFWGSVADGAVFESMAYLDGRRRPHASARSKEILATNRADLGDAEILVRIVDDALQGGLGSGSVELRRRIDERWTPAGRAARTFTDEQIVDACAAWQRMRERWDALPVGDSLELEWPDGPTISRRGSPRGRASRARE